MAASPSHILLGRLLFAASCLGLWQALSSFRIIDPFFFSKPSDVVLRLVQWISEGGIALHLATTLVEALLSFLFGSLAGILAGFLLGRWNTAALILDPFIHMANAVPRIILAPIFLLWFGLGIWSKVALGITTVFFIVFFNTFRGVREVEPVLLNNARMLGASERHLVRHVLVPSALSWIFSSLHTSIGFAIISAVVGEYLGSSRGVGYVIAQAEGVFDTTGVFAGITLLSLVVLLIGRLVTTLERRLLRWKPSPTHGAFSN